MTGLKDIVANWTGRLRGTLRNLRARLSISRSRHPRELHVLSAALRSEPPPEGLLSKIEDDLDRLEPAPRPVMRHPVRNTAIVAVAASIALVILLDPQPKAIQLRTGSGQDIAEIRQRDTTLDLRFSASNIFVAPDMELHLWGLPLDKSAPRHLGRADPGSIPLDTDLVFAGFAISLEAQGFNQAAPAGRILASSQ